MPETDAFPHARALERAAARLREACTERAVPAPEPEEVDRVAILDALRASTLEAWPEGDTEGVLETMRAFEAVRVRLSPEQGDGPLAPMTLAANRALLVREGLLSLSASGDQGETTSFVIEVTAATTSVDEVFEVFPTPSGTGDYTMSHRGLGFALARHLVRRMGSELSVQEREEGGLRFSFS